MAPEVVSEFSQVSQASQVSDPYLYGRIWVPAFLITGVGITLAWIALLAYELVGLVEMAL
jgi:hypothetical protein